jgi:glycogen operon protein
MDFTSGLIGLRKRFPQLRRSTWLTGETNDRGQCDIVWWHPGGREMSELDWHSPPRGALGFVLVPETTANSGANSQTLLVLINRDSGAQTCHLPPGPWRQICDSSADAPFAIVLPRMDTSLVAARSVQLLSQE